MSSFEEYGRYYDLFNEGKDYRAEADYLDGLIRRNSPGAGSLLEFGCGTGGHAFEFARLGYKVAGIDLSEAMINGALERAEGMGSGAEVPAFDVADIRAYRSGRTYDAVASVFHVVSYQATNSDLHGTFASARAHLETGGTFVFDCWYGPGVLTDPPHVRVKRYESPQIIATRTATPTLDSATNTVDVRFDFDVHDKDEGRRLEFSEHHHMRYLFQPEVELMLDGAGFEMLAVYRWMTQEPPGLDTWYTVFVAKAV